MDLNTLVIYSNPIIFYRFLNNINKKKNVVHLVLPKILNFFFYICRQINVYPSKPSPSLIQSYCSLMNQFGHIILGVNHIYGV